METKVDLTQFLQNWAKRLENQYTPPWPVSNEYAEPTPEEMDEDGVDIREAGKRILGDELFNCFTSGKPEDQLKMLNELTVKQQRGDL